MKKTRILILVMSLSAVTPVLLGSAWGVENRSRNGMRQECELRRAKRLNDASDLAGQSVRDSRTGVRAVGAH